MNLTKIISLLLIAIMLMAALPACKGTTTDGATTTAATTTAATTTKAAETTKAPETTEKVTEAPKTYDYTDVFVLDFSKMPDGAAPFSVNGIDNLRIEGGLLKGTSNGGDPNITYTGGDVKFAADTVQAIEIKYLNKSEDYAFQLFFTTDTITGFAENASFKSTLTYSASDGDKNEANVVQIDTSECSDWAGTITNFRMDPFSAAGDFEISYIKFMTMTEKA